MLVRHQMSFEMYPEPAIKLALRTMVGKPFKDTNGEIIGVIKEVKRSKENPKVLEFISEVDLPEEVAKGVTQSFSISGGDESESEGESMVSSDTTRKD